MAKPVASLCAVIAAGLLVSCSTVPGRLSSTPAGEVPVGRTVAFTTTQFTRPYIDVSPDGRQFYFDVLGEIFRAPIEGGPAVKMELGDGWKTQPALSSQGGWIAFHRDHAESPGIWVQRMDSGKRFMALSADQVEQGPLHLLDEPLSLYGGGRRQVNLQAGRGEEFQGDLPGLNGQFRRSPDGRWIGYAALDGDRTVLMLHDVATRRSRPSGCSLDPTNTAQSSATYAFVPGEDAVLLSRDGTFRHCAFDGTERDIAVSADIDIALAPMLVASNLAPTRTQIRHPSMAPRGNEFSFTAKGRIWRSPLGGTPQPLLPEGGESLMPAYAPDGKTMAFVHQEDGVASLRLVDLASGDVRVLASSRVRAYANPAWSPDGSRLAFVDVDQRNNGRNHGPGNDVIQYLSLRDGRITALGKTAPTPNQTHLYPRVSWAPNGEGLYYTREKWSAGGGSVEAIEVLYHPLKGEPIVLLAMQPALQSAAVSASGKHVALQDRLAIAVLPLLHPSDAPLHPRHVTLAEARRLPRIQVNGPDYVWWMPDDQLMWSVQDEIFASRDWRYGRMAANTHVARVTLPASATQPPPIKVYAGGRIIPMAGDEVIEDGAIVTRGATILYVGSASAMPDTFKDEQVTDLTGKTVIPGLIDVHAHRAFGLDDLATLTSQELLAEVAFGVTTVFDPQVSTIKSAYLTDLSRDDAFAGPTFYGSGTSLLGDRSNGAHALIEGPADAHGYVERQTKAGAPLIKAYWRPSRQDRQWLVQAARDLGIGIASDENRTLPVQLGSVQDGYTSVEHTLMLQPAPAKADVIGFMKHSGVSITPTVAIGGNVEAFLAKRTKPDKRTACLVQNPETRTSEHALQARRTLADLSSISVHVKNQLRESAEMLNAGVRVSIGGHGKPAGLISHWEMWALALGGATPMNVLKAATVNGAYKLGMQDRIGALAAGMDADFVILDANPLDDIHNTLEIARVVRRGRTVQWPAGTRVPLSWPVDVHWGACKAWNLGASAMEASGAQLHRTVG